MWYFAWLLGLPLAAIFAVVNAMRPQGSDGLLLVVAPLIPLAGVGTAYGAGADPMDAKELRYLTDRTPQVTAEAAAAHPTLPIPSYARVTNVANGKMCSRMVATASACSNGSPCLEMNTGSTTSRSGPPMPSRT